MLDQSFSFNNFKIIHEIENRKGNYYENHYSNDFHEIVHLIDLKRSELRIEKSKGIFGEEYEKLIKEKEILESLKEKHLENNLIEIANIVNNKSFNFTLNSFKPSITSKTTYSIENSAASYFAVKQLQYNIFRTFKVKQSNRHKIVKQVETLFSDNFPKYIIRTDITQFYESVPQYLLFELINNNQLLSPQSKRLIRNLLYNYNLLTNQLTKPENKRIGIPRGVGISAFLAELYMRKIDNELISMDEISYYGRYVDDILIIFTPKSKIGTSNYFNLIKKIVEDKGLNIRSEKTSLVNLLNGANTTLEIVFLGYKFEFSSSGYNGVKLSNNKKSRYKTKIAKTFESYLTHSIYDKKAAKKILIHRLNYLTKNTRLHKPKKGMIGIYYSNSLLKPECSCLKDLDNILINEIDINFPKATYGIFNDRLKRFSFHKGYKEKLYFNINSKKKVIPDLRSPAERRLRPLVNNFEKIVEAWKE